MCLSCIEYMQMNRMVNELPYYHLNLTVLTGVEGYKSGTSHTYFLDMYQYVYV